MVEKSPKEVAIEVEALLTSAGYMLDDLSFSELVGGRRARYDFSEVASIYVPRNAGAEELGHE